jgi:hypothetical protein
VLVIQAMTEPFLPIFQIPVEAERLRDNDLVLEQYLLPNSPGLAGFRLDFFNVIRPRVTHSPSSSELVLKEFSLTHMEDRFINPGILHMQVTLVKVIRCSLYSKYTQLWFGYPLLHVIFFLCLSLNSSN